MDTITKTIKKCKKLSFLVLILVMFCNVGCATLGGPFQGEPFQRKCEICGQPAVGKCTMRHIYVCETHRYFTQGGVYWRCP